MPEFFPASETTLTPASRTFISSSHSFVLPTTENWGLSFQEEGKAPVGNASFDELKNIMPTMPETLIRK